MLATGTQWRRPTTQFKIFLILDPAGCADDTAGYHNALQAGKPQMSYPRDGHGRDDAGLLNVSFDLTSKHWINKCSDEEYF